MGLFRKKSVAAKEAPANTSSESTNNAAVVAAPPLPARPVSPVNESSNTAEVAPPLAPMEEPTHAISTNDTVDADQHQREVVAREAEQQQAIDRSTEKEREAFGGGAIAGGGLGSAASPTTSERETYPAEKVGGGSNGIVDDGMMKGFVAVPSGGHSAEGSNLSNENTYAAPVDEKSNHHVAEGAALGGLAGIGAAGAGGAFSNEGTDKSLVENNNGHHDEKHVPAPIRTDLTASSPDSSLPNSAASPVANDAASPLSASALAKIHKAEYKDGKRVAKILKQEEKDEARVLENAIKELSNLQKIQRDAASAEAKSAKYHHEALKVQQKANVGYLKHKAIHDEAMAGLKAREEELEITKAQTAQQTQLLQEQSAKVDQLREAKSLDDRARAEKIGSIKRK